MSVVPRFTSQRNPSATRPCLTTSEREVGMMHLSHMERLARIRLGPSKRIKDTMDADFAEEHGGETLRRSDPFGRASSRYKRLVKAEEKDLYKKNQVLLNHLIDSTRDSVRCAQQLYGNTGDKSEMTRRRAEQAKRRWLRRRKSAESIQRANQTLLRHLIEVKPAIRTTKSLNNWYNNVHSNRVATISRFRPAESFAGARILTNECGVKLQRGHPPKTGGSDWGVYDSQSIEENDRTRMTRMPLMRGHPFPPPTLGELMRTVPRALLPPLMSTSYDGYLINASQRQPGPPPRASSARHPPWQSISASDVAMIHHVRDSMLAGGGPTAFVQDHEEGGCTQLWRRAVQRGDREGGLSCAESRPAESCARRRGNSLERQVSGRAEDLSGTAMTGGHSANSRLWRLKGTPRVKAPGYPGSPVDSQGLTSNAASSEAYHQTGLSSDALSLSLGKDPSEHDLRSSTPIPLNRKVDTQYDTQPGEWMANGTEVISTELQMQQEKDCSPDIPYHALLNEWLEASKRGAGKAYIGL
ncbi:unnamed protein product [Phytomonas sp. Hart1]|nr:unnamed protein product [Phytomonas sp. Hart1]|eukprot:CCW68313.1 unnamed protein product [Phytomonas sp. isolate Hart1]